MGLLDEIKDAVEQHPETNEQQHRTLVQTAMDMFANHGGLSDLVKNAEAQGVGHIVQSWVSNGSNQQIAPAQVQSVVGQDRITEFASRAGIPPAVASAVLARILPVVVDKFTPQGKVPKAA